MVIKGSLEKWAMCPQYAGGGPVIYAADSSGLVVACVWNGHYWKFDPKPTEAAFHAIYPWCVKVDSISN